MQNVIGGIGLSKNHGQGGKVTMDRKIYEVVQEPLGDILPRLEPIFQVATDLESMARSVIPTGLDPVEIEG